MYEARNPSASGGRRWTVTRDGTDLTEIHGSAWRLRGHLALAGRGYTITASWTGSRYELRPADGPGSAPGDAPVARAERVGRKDWTITTGDAVHAFRRGSWWRGDQHLVEGGHVLGHVRPTGGWRGGVVAELPGLPEVVAVFALAVVLFLREQYAAAGTAAG